MLRVGLTGGTGAGKTTVARRLAELGALVVDADGLAREVVAPGSEGLAQVLEEFGAGVLQPDGGLDRPALAAMVFADPARRRVLEAITHPRIAARTAQILAEAPADAVVVHDVPLLVEKRMGAGYHLVVVVMAPEDVRVRRLVRSREMTTDDARARLRAQATDDERRATADVLLDNGGPPDVVLREVDELWHTRLVPFERNVRERVPAPRPSAVARLSPPDPTWLDAGQRLVERVRFAVGERAAGVEHIGSTAVPGLPAKDVIDLQLRVRSLDVADELKDALESAGFARLPDQWWDEEPSGNAPKRLHCSCDPGRAVNLHVRAPGWTAPRQVLFRDWLRAHDDERDAYAAVKRAGEGLSIQEYTDGKGPWIRAAYRRAEAWADRTGWALH